ncbi:MAG: VTT domain-containing protein [Opitutales bacterium]|nr:VTT domain-containing protein [Opitutales bacterium]MDG1326133.1 VTT domain-containing protein [Opitutales bacterium]
MKLIKSKLFLTFFLVLSIFSILGVLYFGLIAIGGDESKQYLLECWFWFKEFLLNNGIWLFVALTVLPGFILPCAPFLFLFGIWGTKHGAGYACFYSVLALSLNLVWTYWLAHGIGRSFIDKLLQRFKYNIPELPPNNLVQWAIILRLTPGIPFIFTNYALGLLKLPFSKYLLVSIPIVAITDCGFVLASAGIFGGSWKFIWGGISILIIMIIIGHNISKKQNNADKSI